MTSCKHISRVGNSSAQAKVCAIGCLPKADFALVDIQAQSSLLDTDNVETWLIGLPQRQQDRERIPAGHVEGLRHESDLSLNLGQRGEYITGRGQTEHMATMP